MSDLPDNPFGFDEPLIPEDVLAAERSLYEALQKATGQFDREIFGLTTSAAVEPATLTMEQVQKTMNDIGSMIIEQYERTPFSRGFPPLPFPLSAVGVPIYTSPFLGKTVYPQPPAMKKGPYLKRRIKRWHRAHPPYTVGDGQYWWVNGEQIWCHPDDLAKLTQTLDWEIAHHG